MLKCSDLELGKTYECECCGLSIKVEKECKHNETCDCANDDSCCSFSCCGKDMVAKTEG